VHTPCFSAATSHLTHDSLLHYYRLRFQIEFNFRDAKQFWGMEDFMVIKETPVTNAVNLALFMVNVSRRLLADFHQRTARRWRLGFEGVLPGPQICPGYH
jgi:hypothetical protein